MYITAHRVRSNDGRTGINSDLFLHGDADVPMMQWDAPHAGRVAEKYPGHVKLSNDDVKPRGNHVLSYLDVACADSIDLKEVEKSLESFVAEVQKSGAPVEKTIGRVGIRFGCVFGLEGQEDEEF